MGLLYRCTDPNCGFENRVALDVPIPKQCPRCSGIVSISPAVDANRTLTLGEVATDPSWTQTLGSVRDRSSPPDAERATLTFPEPTESDDQERRTLSLPESNTAFDAVSEFHLGPIATPPSSILNAKKTNRRNAETRAGVDPNLSRIGRFELRSCLGEGAFGVVYQAYDPQLDRLVALKVAKPGSLDSPTRRERFLIEAKSAANLRHPNIVPLYEIGSEGGSLFLCSALIQGQTLENWIQSTGRDFSTREAVRVTRRLAEALAYAHSVGIIHRDVKPQNVLIDERGEPHLTDFGLAARQSTTGDHANREPFALGTPAYMAPEQAVGASEEASDQYSLGCTLFEMLSGVTPFAGGPAQQVFLHRTEPAPPLRRLKPSIPRDLEAICAKSLAKAPQARYANCAELAEDLRRYAAGEATHARPPRRAERLVKWVKRSPFQAATLFAALALIGAVVVALAQDARFQRAEVAELRRQDEVLARFTTRYQSARSAADSARSTQDDVLALERWTAADRDADSGILLVENEPSQERFTLLDELRLIRDEARGQLAGARRRAEARSVLPRIKKTHAEAVLFDSESVGLEVRDTDDRAGNAIRTALQLVGINPDNTGPPQLDPLFFTAVERILIADRCAELLLLEAERLARPLIGERIESLRGRLPRALRAIERSENLFSPPAPTRSGLELKARIYQTLEDSTRADEMTRLAATIDPNTAADRVLQAFASYRKGRYLDAMAPLAVTLREQPDHFGAEYLLAVCRLREGRFLEAREGFTRCLEVQPEIIWPRVLRGFALIQLRRFDDAEFDLQDVLQKTSDTLARYVARVNLGVLDLNRGRLDGAVVNLNAAIEQKPTAAAAYLNLALTHRKQGEAFFSDPSRTGLAVLSGGLLLGREEAWQQMSRRDALATLDRGAIHCPDNALIFHERARARLTMADFKGAEEDFRRSIERSDNAPNSTLADDLIELGRLLTRREQHEEAVRAFRKALTLRPDRAVAYRLLAQPLLALDRPSEAGEALDRYLATVPLTPGVPPSAKQEKELAEAHRARGQVFEEEARAFRTRGTLYLLQNGFRPAIDQYTHSLEYRHDPETYCLRGWAYLVLNAAELAEADFEAAVRLDPTSPNALLGRGNARVRVGKATEALKDADEGFKLGQADARHCFNAARIYAQATPVIRKNASPLKGPEGILQAVCERKSIAALRQALDRTPYGDRLSFWQKFVQKDTAFDSVRNGFLFSALSKEYERLR